MVRDSSRPVGVIASSLAQGGEGRAESFEGLMEDLGVGSRSRLATTDRCVNATVVAYPQYVTTVYLRFARVPNSV
jgi:hypothetical protein